MKVLLAEDDTITARALKENLHDWGYDVIVTHDGKDAWDIISGVPEDHADVSKEIRLAVFDWEMPNMDGIELCRRVRQKTENDKGKYIYVILLTGKDRQEDIIDGLSSGADDYITKPFDFLELRVRLKNGERIIRLEDDRLEMALTDNLTQLWNRKKILDFLKEEVSRGKRYGQSTGVIMCDIDNFKKINDSLGHQTGDKVLSEIASRLKQSARSYDKIGRYGGDEFLAVFPDCLKSFIPKIAERLRKTVENMSFPSESKGFSVTVSVGGTSNEFNLHISADEMINLSDRALLAAKGKGRNSSVIYFPS
ncbi:MAG: diguanylate cyclase [Candidatus Aminicenantes bacterium]